MMTVSPKGTNFFNRIAAINEVVTKLEMICFTAQDLANSLKMFNCFVIPFYSLARIHGTLIPL
jgi:hypothetical protein